MATGPSKRQIQGQLRDELKNHEAIQDSLKAEAEWYKSIGDSETARAKATEQISERQGVINDLLANYNKLSMTQVKQLEDLQTEQKEAIKNEKEINNQLKKQKANREVINGVLRENGKLVKEGWKYLMESDKVIKSTILNLGMSGTKADLMRGSFEQSAGFVARLGGSLEDIQKIMEGYADETGRARVLSAEMVEDITMIGKGTGLGIEQATKLGAQFEFMGLSARGTMDYVQGIVDTSERMGVNTTKVLRSLSDNFKKLNTFTFTKGSKAMAEMAMNAQKMQVDLADALNIAEATRGLENVIELTANLQVMGGEFAKLDPFQALFMSRNEPEKWNEEISKMTRGLFTFKKNSEGVFEKFIAPVDADRLRGVAKSLGISAEELFKIGQRRLDLDSMNKDMMAMGLSPREKELVQGAAVFNEKSAKFEVMLAGKMRDISTLTADQAKSFAKEQVSLGERAKQAQTFNEVFKATIMELKAALLPLLQTVNAVLVKMRPLIIKFTEWISKGPNAWIKVALLFMGVATTIKLAGGMLSRVSEGLLNKLPGIGKLGGGGGGGETGRIIGGRAGAGKGLMRGGAGVGVAAAGLGAMGVGIGEGINLAATGISKLADSMSKLTPEQAKALKDIAMTLAIAFPAAAIGIAAVGLAGSAGALGILAVGAAMVGVGFGIKLATDGIAKMALGLSELNKSGGGAGKQLLGVAGGVGAITLAMMGGGIPALFAFNNSLGRMAKNAPAIALIGETFKQINATMSGSKENYLAVESAVNSISKMKGTSGAAFAGLAAMLSKPLKVQFDDKDVALNTYVTLDVNGEKFLQTVGTTAYVTNNQSRAKQMVETVKHR